jgi:hypothetical protein
MTDDKPMGRRQTDLTAVDLAAVEACVLAAYRADWQGYRNGASDGICELIDMLGLTNDAALIRGESDG